MLTPGRFRGMYERVLVPTDGSENVNAAIDHAVDLAKQYGAAIDALYVVNTGAMPSPDPEFREEFVDEGERIGRDAVDAVVAAAEAAGVEATGTVVHGTPYEEIVDYATDTGDDVIVMGTHGRTGLGHFLLGSVAERVIQQADVPVMVVRSPDA